MLSGALKTLFAVAENYPNLKANENFLQLQQELHPGVGVAIGYKDREGWASEGWWTAEPQKCLTLLKGTLIARYYYVYAVDYDKGGSWGGKAMMCIRDKIFTIRGIDSCTERGYQKTGFFEVDTSEEADWTISLSGEKTSQGQ